MYSNQLKMLDKGAKLNILCEAGAFTGALQLGTLGITDIGQWPFFNQSINLSFYQFASTQY